MKLFYSYPLIPEYLLTATADCWYDFSIGTSYFIFSPGGRLCKTVKLKSEQDQKDLWKYHVSPDWILLEEIYNQCCLYKVENGIAKVILQNSQEPDIYPYGGIDCIFPPKEFEFVDKFDCPKYFLSALSIYPDSSAEDFLFIDSNNKVFCNLKAGQTVHEGDINDIENLHIYTEDDKWYLSSQFQNTKKLPAKWILLESIGDYQEVYRIKNQRPVLLQKSESGNNFEFKPSKRFFNLFTK